MALTSRATDLQPRRGSADHPPLDLRADVLRQLAGHAQDLLSLAAVHGKRNVRSDAGSEKSVRLAQKMQVGPCTLVAIQQ